MQVRGSGQSLGLEAQRKWVEGFAIQGLLLWLQENERERERERETERQRDRETERQRDRETERQSERE